MDAGKIIISFALLVVCAIAVQGGVIKTAQENNVNIESELPETQEDNFRSKRFIPYAQTYHATGYSYLGAYPNSVSGIHYTAPVVAPVISHFGSVLY